MRRVFRAMQTASSFPALNFECERGRKVSLMSTALTTETGLPERKLKLLTRREQRYVASRLKGESMQEAARQSGLPAWMARTRELASVEALVDEASQALAEIRYDQCLIDAVEIHEYLTDAIRADWADIQNDDGTFKPLSEWPEIWRRMKEKGEVEVEEASVRSHDGKDTDGLGGWEKSGKTVTKVKIAFGSKVKLLELAMKHRAVNAMVDQKAGDVNLNLVVVTAEKARQVVNARKRLGKVLDVTPEVPEKQGT